VPEESDESFFWLELLADSGVLQPDKVHPLLNEANELGFDFRCLSANG